MIMKETDVMPGKSAEESLDPEDWESMRMLGHRILDDMMDYLETLRDRPAWQHAPVDVKAHFAGSPPRYPPNTRRDLSGVHPVHTALPDRQQPSAFLGLGSWNRNRDGDVCGADIGCN